MEQEMCIVLGLLDNSFKTGTVLIVHHQGIMAYTISVLYYEEWLRELYIVNLKMIIQ